MVDNSVDRIKAVRLVADTLRDKLEINIPIEIKDVVSKLGGIMIVSNTITTPYTDNIHGENAEFTLYAPKDIVTDKQILRTAIFELAYLIIGKGYLIDTNRWNEYNPTKKTTFMESYDDMYVLLKQFVACFMMPQKEYVRLITQRFIEDEERKNKSNDELIDKDVQYLASCFNATDEDVLLRGTLLGYRFPKYEEVIKSYKE